MQLQTLINISSLTAPASTQRLAADAKDVADCLTWQISALGVVHVAQPVLRTRLQESSKWSTSSLSGLSLLTCPLRGVIRGLSDPFMTAEMKDRDSNASQEVTMLIFPLGSLNCPSSCLILIILPHLAART